ncbi:reverse transcriptase/maturase family protein [Rhodoferax sp. TBRC 17198]|uniref:reverse transcriptase/maturase family protein n=1 Tax=Rhodoferax potami TaxID=3068338 RepID=UPI0028BD4CA4|nr:reverse transcriptase/maturase family protein [Rhodoferax sp. TBRC 17198]MDT7524393.1 reverse transcriptase/maturase family protein [Rhodoferax sp. TBRC 17198]MDT7524484.1 reverse transcriptase/maturase family protein [Rhodoferax sp. TBRC 17198]
MVLALAHDIASGHYRPSGFTVFAVTDPKLREIFAPAFADRLVQQWLVQHIEPWWNKRFIDDSYANRQGKGTQAAIGRLQHFMRQPGHRWYCQLDIRAFFPSIDRRILLQLRQTALPKLPWPASTRQQLDQVATAIIQQSPTEPPPRRSGDIDLLARVPPHKSLFGAPPGVGMPIGSLTSQFFANVYLNELDQFVKHTLKVRGYIRYVDDFVLLADAPQTLLVHKARIEQFLQERLRLQLHPTKTVLQRCSQGADFLGAIVHPHHRLTRQRAVRALKRRLHWFRALVFPHDTHHPMQQPSGSWQRWLANHQAIHAHGYRAAAAHAGHPQQLLRHLWARQHLALAQAHLRARTRPPQNLLPAGRPQLPPPQNPQGMAALNKMSARLRVAQTRFENVAPRKPPHNT